MLAKQLLVNRAPRLILQAINSRPLTLSSQRQRRPKQHYRLWSLPGEFIHYKDILAKQHTMYWHPGLNTGIDNLRTIYALCDGIMVVTEDAFDPDWEHPITSEAYTTPNGEKQPPLNKRYIHVIPRRRVPEFKLIDAI